MTANANGNHVVIKGPKDATDHARRVLEMLYERAKMGQSADLGDVEGAIAEGALQGSLFPNDPDARPAFHQIKTRKRGVVRARNAAQDTQHLDLRTIVGDQPVRADRQRIAEIRALFEKLREDADTPVEIGA